MVPAQRLRLTSLIITLGCLASMAVSHRLWLGGGRTFPRVPMIDALAAVGPSVEILLTLAFAIAIISAAGLSGVWSRRFDWLAVILAFVLMVLDQMRMQPWLLQYALMWMVLGSRNVRYPGPDDGLALRTLRLIVVCIYIYSGLHKINASFFAETARLVLEPIANVLPPDVPVNSLGYVMPALEVFIGVGLMFRATRTPAVAAAVLMHVGILLLIGPLGRWHNAVVWPWNLAMIGLVVVLFAWRETPAPVARPSKQCVRVRRVAIVLAGVVPIGGLFGWMDVYLSWGMYAGAPPLSALEMSPAMVARLPEAVQKQVVTRTSGTKAIFVQDWSFADLQVVYPEERIIRAVARSFVPYMELRDDMQLHIIPRPGRFTNERVRVTVPMEEWALPGEVIAEP